MCGALYAASVELPLPAPPNPYNRECVVRRTIKCHWDTVADALGKLAITTVYIGHFGCKVPVAPFEQAFSMGQAFLEGTAFDLAFEEKIVASMCLFGLANGKGTFKLNGQQYNAYTHRTLRGFVHPDEGFRWGTLELRLPGHSA